MNYIAKLQKLHEELVEPRWGTAVGCSPEEIERLEHRIGSKLPAAYCQWLLWMGRDKDGILRGTDCFIWNVGMDRDLLEQLAGWDHDRMPIPEQAFVFYSHQGYVAAWFLLPCTDGDPEVFFFSEGRGLIAPHPASTFSEFMLEDLRGLATLLPRAGTESGTS